MVKKRKSEPPRHSAKEKQQEILNKLNQLLQEDEQFKKKFERVFDTEERLTFQVAGVEPDEMAEASRGCSCLPYLCGKGCFASYPGARGYVVG